MEARKPVFGKSNSVEDMQHVRLMALLEEHGMTLPPETYPPAGLRAGRADRMAKDRALRHAESAGKVGATPARSHPVALAEVAGSRRGGCVVNFCEHFGGNLRKGACRPSHRGAGPLIMSVLFGFLQGFRP